MEKHSYIRIPQDRIGVLIGPDGKTKNLIEKSFNINLIIDSKIGNVEIILPSNHEDVSVLFTVSNIVKAIGRGFNPKKAIILRNENYDLSIIDLEDFVGKSTNAQDRVKGRIIGREGKSRLLIEELTETQISIYGSTVSIIGNIESLSAAKEAIMMLVRGSFHKTVWNYLYAYRRDLKKSKTEIWFDQTIKQHNRRRQRLDTNINVLEDG
ncbi:RNA-processing protein [Candidatus Bathyarchaeota archaeon]|nr:RNA-processing protein [Candidatus Bathyarchaeota archaeon]